MSHVKSAFVVVKSVASVTGIVAFVVASAGAACPKRIIRTPSGPPPPNLFAMPDRPVCDGAYDDAVDVAAVSDAGLLEISGIAASVNNADVAYAIADAGNASAVYALSLSTGATRLVLDLPIDNVDFEDIAVAPCPDLSGPCVYIADTGDNDNVRDHVAVYAFAEPVIAADAPAGSAVVDTVYALLLAYPDGESVDVEAVAVLPDASAILLFEKTTAPLTSAGARIFAAKAPWSLASAEDNPPAIVVQSGTVDTGSGADDVITGAAAHWSGQRLLLRTATKIIEFTGETPADFLDLSSSNPRQELPSPAGEDNRGEAVCYDEAGVDVVSVAEAADNTAPVVHRSACP